MLCMYKYMYFVHANARRLETLILRAVVVATHLLQVVCEATQCTDSNVRKAAYEAIWTIATLYYDRLQVSRTR